MVHNRPNCPDLSAIEVPATTRRDAILAGSAILASTLHYRHGYSDEKGQQGQAALSQLALEPVSALRPDIRNVSWESIGLLGVDGRLLQSVTLLPAAAAMALGQDPKSFPNTRLPLFRQFRYEETDAELMRFLSFALPTFPLCFALAPDMRGGWGGSGMRIALLRMQTNLDTFWVSVTRIGFALGSDGAEFTNIFFSGTLALAVKLIYKRATGEALPELIEDALSGKRHLDQESEQFRKWMASQP